MYSVRKKVDRRTLLQTAALNKRCHSFTYIFQ